MSPRAARSSIALALVLLAAPLLAGCLGFAEDDGTDEPVQKQQARVDNRLGGLQGVVTDDAIQPVVGANVTLVEVDETVQTAGDGSFAFSLVPPGAYTVTVNAPGFVSAQQEVTVRSNQVSVVDFIVTHLVSQDAYTQHIEFSAFIECAVGAGVNLTALDLGYPSITWATCATLNLDGNTTNDDFSENVELEAPINTLVWETRWDPSGNTLGENLWLVADIQGFAGITADNETLFQDTSVSSPFRAQIPNSTFHNVSEWFSQQCEEGNDEYCGHNFWDKGWPITIRTFTAVDCLDAPASSCAPLQMKVDHVYSAFYNAPAPAGFSIFGGNTQ